MKKRLISVLLLICLAFSLFSCTANRKEDDKLTILCTLFPQYDWLRNITEGVEGIELSLIIANGADPHSYQPTATDIMNISNCDVLVYLGGDSDAWLSEALERSGNESITQIALSELDGITLCEISASSHSHEGHEHSHEGHEHSSVDEHLYLSLKNASVATNALADALSAKDPENAELYAKNADAYIEKLEGMSADFEESLATLDDESRFILFADRFPFVYLLSDYDVHYSAAFEGCTTDVDAGFDTVIRLIEEADEHEIKYIAVTESSDKALAETVAFSTKTNIEEIIVLNSMQSVTSVQIKNGADYLSIMQENLNAINKALGITE